jgi:hypothetical protein
LMAVPAVIVGGALWLGRTPEPPEPVEAEPS